MRLHNALKAIHRNLISNTTTFRKKMFWPVTSSQGPRVCVRTESVRALCSMLHFLLTPSGVKSVCKDRIWAGMVLYVPRPLILYATWLLSVKMTLLPHQALNGMCKHKKIVWPLTQSKGSGSRGKILITGLLIYKHWVIMAYSEKLS